MHLFCSEHFPTVVSSSLSVCITVALFSGALKAMTGFKKDIVEACMRQKWTCLGCVQDRKRY